MEGIDPIDQNFFNFTLFMQEVELRYRERKEKELQFDEDDDDLESDTESVFDSEIKMENIPV